MTGVHEELNQVVAAMPAEQVQHVLNFARQLAAGEVEYGDWTDEDLKALSDESMRRFDAEHPEDEGYGDLVPR